MTEWERIQLLLPMRFSKAELKWRIQRSGEGNKGVWASVVPFISAQDLQARLDAVVGAGNWWNEYRPTSDGKGLFCGITISVAGSFVTKWDGASETDGAGNKDLDALKGGISNSLKRAGVQWGVARYLYNVGDLWATVVEGGAYRAQTKDKKTFYWNPPAVKGLEQTQFEAAAMAIVSAGSFERLATIAGRIDDLSKESGGLSAWEVEFLRAERKRRQEALTLTQPA